LSFTLWRSVEKKQKIKMLPGCCVSLNMNYTLEPAGQTRGGVRPGRRSPGGDGGEMGRRRGFSGRRGQRRVIQS
jgi:hypothetical protein